MPYTERAILAQNVEVRAMADYASLLGGNPTDTLLPAAVQRDEDAYYRIEAANVFIDRFDTSGDAIVDGGNSYYLPA